MIIKDKKIILGEVACYPKKFWLHIFCSHFMIAKFCMPGVWLAPILLALGVFIAYVIWYKIFSSDIKEDSTPFFFRKTHEIEIEEILKKNKDLPPR